MGDARSSRSASSVSRFRTATRRRKLRRQLQPPQRIVPHAFERRAHRTQGGAARSIEPLRLFRSAVDQACLRERPQLQRDRPERDVGHGAVDVARRQFVFPDQSQDLAPAWRGDRTQGGRVEQHGLILVITKIKSRRRRSAFPQPFHGPFHRDRESGSRLPRRRLSESVHSAASVGGAVVTMVVTWSSPVRTRLDRARQGQQPCRQVTVATGSRTRGGRLVSIDVDRVRDPVEQPRDFYCLETGRSQVIVGAS